tara:strand:- start:27 stop:380 length:354 start_codon:yes stop_codon:yes gene_type:complete
MWSHVQLVGDTVEEEIPLPDYYEGEQYWKYFHKEETWYDDSNFYSNPFEDDFPRDGPQGPEFGEDVNENYSVLGLKRSASDEDIKQAFREKALKTHPDKGGDAEDFKRVREAYENLI